MFVILYSKYSKSFSNNQIKNKGTFLFDPNKKFPMMANVQIVGFSTTEFYLNQIKFTGRCARIIQSRPDAATSSKESSDLGMAIINLFDSNNLLWASLKYGTPNYLIYNKLHLLLKQIA